jgi:hypothetical protein
VSIALQSVRVETGSPDQEGCLMFAGDKLAAVLVRLSAEHGEKAGGWYVEKGFGRLDAPSHPVFPDLQAAQDWISQQIG